MSLSLGTQRFALFCFRGAAAFSYMYEIQDKSVHSFTFLHSLLRQFDFEWLKLSGLPINLHSAIHNDEAPKTFLEILSLNSPILRL